MKNNRYSMFVGRFQPFHNGHKWLIEQRLKLGKKILIAVMDIHKTEPKKNPFETEEVIKIISKKMAKQIEEGIIQIISIPPVESLNYGRTVGYEVIEHIPPEEIKQISATKIRSEMYHTDEMQKGNEDCQIKTDNKTDTECVQEIIKFKKETQWFYFLTT